MGKLMIVTVGTSLFQSASWNKDEEGLKLILRGSWEHYSRFWAVDEEDRGLRSPEYRKKNDYGLEALFKKELTIENANAWVSWLAPYDNSPKTHKMRYSAEIATILSFAESESKARQQSWQEYLRGYEIYFVHDSDVNSPTARAAKHHEAYLQRLMAGGVELPNIKCWGIKDFSANSPRQLGDGLRSYQGFLKDARFTLERFESIDVIISGGYKVYGLVGYGFLLDERFRVIYLHEELLDAVIQSKDTLKVGSTLEIPFLAIIE